MLGTVRFTNGFERSPLAAREGVGSLAEKTKYRLWLKFRIGNSLDTGDDALTASIGGRTVTIESEHRGEPLSKASWLVMSCRGFEAEAQAREFEDELRRATHLAGLCNRVGVDARDPGQNRTVSWLNPEVFRRTNPEKRLAPDVHGIVVLPDDGNKYSVADGRTARFSRTLAISSALLRSVCQRAVRPEGVRRRFDAPFVC